MAASLVMQMGLLTSSSARWPLRRRGDQALTRAARNGSEEALAELIRRHWAGVARGAMAIIHDRHGAEDVAQETMLAIVANLERFDLRRPLAPWLHRVMVNKSLDWIRSQNRVPTSEPDLDPPAPADRDVELDPGLLTALARIDPEDRAIVVLRHILDYRSKEIGAILDLPPATVRTRLARALESLRGDLDRGEDER